MANIPNEPQLEHMWQAPPSDVYQKLEPKWIAIPWRWFFSVPCMTCWMDCNTCSVPKTKLSRKTQQSGVPTLHVLEITTQNGPVSQVDGAYEIITKWDPTIQRPPNSFKERRRRSPCPSSTSWSHGPHGQTRDLNPTYDTYVYVILCICTLCIYVSTYW